MFLDPELDTSLYFGWFVDILFFVFWSVHIFVKFVWELGSHHGYMCVKFWFVKYSLHNPCVLSHVWMSVSQNWWWPNVHIIICYGDHSINNRSQYLFHFDILTFCEQIYVPWPRVGYFIVFRLICWYFVFCFLKCSHFCQICMRTRLSPWIYVRKILICEI